MVKLSSIYTKCGDTGETSLAAGHPIAKNSLRINAIGDVDELNATLGLASVAIEMQPLLQVLGGRCLRIQNELFNLGSHLAVLLQDRRLNTPLIYPQNITLLEQEIDEMNLILPTLHSFILPGGGEISARLHLTRTVCRRAERTLCLLIKEDVLLKETALPYLNRLSDWLFVAARFSMALLHEPEILWQK